MGSADHESEHWVRELVAGNDDVMREFWSAYGASLERLARSRMSPALQRRIGAEDVVQSVCRTFIRRAQQGQFQLAETESLWRLLCALTLTKVRQHARFHLRKKRGMDREVPLPPDSQAGEVPAVTPHEALEFADQMAALTASLDAEQQQIVEGKLDGLDNQQIAGRLGCSERTVRRLLHQIEQRWRRELERHAAM